MIRKGRQTRARRAGVPAIPRRMQFEHESLLSPARMKTREMAQALVSLWSSVKREYGQERALLTLEKGNRFIEWSGMAYGESALSEKLRFLESVYDGRYEVASSIALIREVLRLLKRRGASRALDAAGAR